MLVISRGVGQRIYCDGPCLVKVIRLEKQKSNKVRLGIEALKTTKIARGELINNPQLGEGFSKLILNRKLQEDIIAFGPCVIEILNANTKSARLMICADRETKVLRGELTLNVEKQPA